LPALCSGMVVPIPSLLLQFLPFAIWCNHPRSTKFGVSRSLDRVRMVFPRLFCHSCLALWTSTISSQFFSMERRIFSCADLDLFFPFFIEPLTPIQCRSSMRRISIVLLLIGSESRLTLRFCLASTGSVHNPIIVRMKTIGGQVIDNNILQNFSHLPLPPGGRGGLAGGQSRSPAPAQITQCVVTTLHNSVTGIKITVTGPSKNGLQATPCGRPHTRQETQSTTDDIRKVHRRDTTRPTRGGSLHICYTFPILCSQPPVWRSYTCPFTFPYIHGAKTPYPASFLTSAPCRTTHHAVDPTHSAHITQSTTYFPACVVPHNAPIL
jgi:hypothetical protein